VRRGAWAGLAVGLLPGWRAELRPVPHASVLAAAAAAPGGSVTGVEVRDGAGRTWHAQYLGSGAASLLSGLGLGGGVASLVPPDHVAWIVDGKAAGYFAVERSLRWPWWWPGGGVNWDTSEPG